VRVAIVGATPQDSKSATVCTCACLCLSKRLIRMRISPPTRFARHVRLQGMRCLTTTREDAERAERRDRSCVRCRVLHQRAESRCLGPSIEEPLRQPAGSQRARDTRNRRKKREADADSAQRSEAVLLEREPGYKTGSPGHSAAAPDRRPEPGRSESRRVTLNLCRWKWKSASGSRT
jgi:hypothetical protein